MVSDDLTIHERHSEAKMKHALSLPLLCTLLILSACTKKASQDDTIELNQHKANQDQVSSAQESPVDGVVDGETYQLITPQKQGEPLRVQAKAGYKVNDDFPHRLLIKSSPKDVSVEGVKSAGELRFATSTLSCEGDQCKGSADFSICNDQMCKLYRDVAVSWSAR
jgi:PBP1b-binding outer membrane lipoprotein LpoB